MHSAVGVAHCVKGRGSADDFTEEEPYALLDLTCLLTTGRTSEGLMDYMGSAEHMSDRVSPLLFRQPQKLICGYRAFRSGTPLCVMR